MPPKIDPARARQGRGGRTLLTLLIAALVIAALGWWALHVYFSSITPAQKTFEAEPGQTTNQPPPSPTTHLDNPATATPQQNGTPPPDAPRQ